MTPWVECPALDIDLDLPLERRYADVPRDAFEKGRRLLDTVMEEMPAAARVIADAVRLRTGNRFHAEARALARFVGGDWRSIVLANVSYDLALSFMGCSTVALPTPEGPVLARNMDWWPEDVLAQTSYLVRYHREGVFCFANAGWPGAIGVVTGLSAKGFGIALNAVLWPEGLDKLGYPVLLHLRRVLEDAASFDTALKMLSKQRLASPCLLTLVGRENHQRVVIERTPRRHALRWAEDGRPLVATNDYRLLFKPRTGDVDPIHDKPRTHDAGEIYQTTCSRYDALQRFFADHSPDRAVNDTALLYVLSDPTVIQQITAQHVIMRPRSDGIGLFVPRGLTRSH